MSALAAFPASPPLIAVARVLGRFDRSTLEAFMTVAVELLDVADGDADLEDEGEAEPDDADEDDDPDTSVEDGPRGFDPEEDFGGEEAGEPEDYAIEDFSDPDALRDHRARIRRTRCDQIEYVSPWSHSPRVEFRLKDPPSLNC